MNDKQYDVVFSFAEEQREYAEELARKLSQSGIDVFLDCWDVNNPGARDVASYFASAFPRESLYVVTIFSKEYNEKAWPTFEFEIMQDRQMQKEQYILPITYDGSFPKSWPRTRGFIDKNQFSVDEIVYVIREKVWSQKNKRNDEDLDSELPSSESKNMIWMTKPDGTEEQVEVILSFKFKDTNKEYMIYTKNERDGHGYVDVYVSRVDRSDGEPKLYGVDDEDWIKIKEIVWELGYPENAGTPPPMPSEAVFNKDGIEVLEY